MFLPIDTVQTNNRAELLVLICLVQHVHGEKGCLATTTDSRYVYDGVTGAAYRWRDSRFVDNQGPVANVDLCIVVLHLLDSATMSLRWVKVPSHTVLAIEGNRRADHVA